ncbi:baculoviral IAP repeat-containing protein 2 X3 [Biomphalaria glabrata]|nr:baculoviral IAP repeat-containing protein 2 X3 [Biomphalaria glabrata]
MADNTIEEDGAQVFLVTEDQSQRQFEEASKTLHDDNVKSLPNKKDCTRGYKPADNNVATFCGSDKTQHGIGNTNGTLQQHQIHTVTSGKSLSNGIGAKKLNGIKKTRILNLYFKGFLYSIHKTLSLTQSLIGLFLDYAINALK